MAATIPLSINWTAGLSQAWNSVATFVPKLVVFLVVLFIGWIIAKVVAKALGMLLEKVGFTKLLNKAGAENALRNAQIEPLGLVTKLVYYFILLIALQLALTAFGSSNPVSQIVNQIVGWLPKAFVAVIIVVIAGAVANAVKDLMGAALGGLSYGALLTKITGAFILALGIIAALNQIGIGLSVTLPVLITALATVGGILVVGVGGGLIGPMRQRWEGWLTQLSTETGNRQQVDAGTVPRQALGHDAPVSEATPGAGPA